MNLFKNVGNAAMQQDYQAWSNPFCWDLHVDNLIGEPSSWLYVWRIASFMAILYTHSLSYLITWFYPYLHMA